MQALNEILAGASDVLWGVPMVSILLITGFFLTLRLLFIQFRGFAHGVAITSGRYDDPKHKGQLTHFQALSAALSATIGIGNIGGVAIGIYWGGPGAIFWMWVTALFGMAIKYTECTLAIKHRKIEPDGNIRGGPMYYIELGMHRYFKPLAILFALCTAVAALGAGNMVQSNTLADSLVNAFKVGYSTVSMSQIKCAKFEDLASAHNAAVDSSCQLVARKDLLLASIRDTQRQHGPDSPALAAQREELAELNRRLVESRTQVQNYRDTAGDMRFVVSEDAAGQVFYLKDEVPTGRPVKDGQWGLKIGNERFDATAVTLVEEGPVGQWRWTIGIVLSILVGFVIIGGIRRIGRVASYLVPFMSVVYVLSALVVLLMHADKILPAFDLIFYHAFNPAAAVGGSASGVTVWMTITWGMRRGLFSNESGQGSAAMAHSTAKVEEPVREGMVAMLGPFIDTLLICTMTALVIITSGLWDCGLNSAPLTMAAFDKSLPVYGKWMVVVGILLFSYSTVLSWSYYGEKGIEYILGSWSKLPYKYVYVIFTLLGARLDLVAVWSFADIANGMMAVPNLFALIGLSGIVYQMTRKYMSEKAQGLHVPFRYSSPPQESRTP